MKDTPTKPLPLVPKPKSAIKKEKMPTKKPKESKAPAAKTPRGRKPNAKVAEKKPKVNNAKQDVPKRKRGRPRNEEKFKNQVKLKEPKPKGTPGRKRKLPENIVIKTEKEDFQSPPKKVKSNDTNHSMNGNSKMPLTDLQKQCAQKEIPPVFLNHTITNNINSNGVFHHCQKGLDFGSKKSTPGGAVSKSVTFQPVPTSNNIFNNLSKPFKHLPNKSIKSILKNEVVNNSNSVNHNHQSKDDTIQISPKDIKVEKGNNLITPFRSPIKLHPQRMASLDALAKMHVICIPDRKPVEHHSKSTTSVVTTVCAEPFTHQKSLTQCHQRIQFDMKKESKDFKGGFVHKQINFVKEKQQVFVSHSVEQSKTISTKSQKKKTTKVNQAKKPVAKEHKQSGKAASSSKLAKSSLTFPAKGEKKKAKVSSKDQDKKCAKTQGKSSKATKKSPKEKPVTKTVAKKSKKLEQTKSEVKVKETIRMQKTCTYQSVTTVNSHGTTNSSVVPVSHVGLTTNYSKTKKTVVTDEECKNKINYSSGSVVNNSYCVTSESPCSIGHHADCCKFHAHSSPQIIPFAHVQTCALGHGLNRTSDSSSSSPSHCDGNFSVHRFGHQPTVIYSPPSPEYGCCCSGSIVQNVHDPCLLRKSIMTYPHHSHHHPSNFSTEALCAEYHHPGNDTTRHFGLPSSSRCCTSCCDPLPAGIQYLSSTGQKSQQASGLSSCEQSPLDLSLSSAGPSVEADPHLQQGLCQSPLCCSSRKVLVLRTPSGFQQHASFQAGPSNSACYRLIGGQISCESQSSSEPSQLAKPALDPLVSSKELVAVPPVAIASTSGVTNKSLSASTSGVTNKSLSASTSGVANKSLSVSAAQRSVGAGTSGVASHQLVPAKREKGASPKHTLKHLPKRKQFAHGWSWKGKPREKMIALTNDTSPCPRICYPSVEHKEGDVINEKDCVLLRSGPKDTDLPYVAKVATFWENPEDGEMMMSLLWYYRPEHTDHGRKPGQMEDEVFASRHKDVNSIACIEDKCYVLTYNEYCRYRAKLNMDDDLTSMSSRLVPDLPDGYPRNCRLPSEVVATDIIFFCRHVYDFRQKRILKNPT